MFASSHARMLHHEFVGEFAFGYLEHEHLLGSEYFLEFRVVLHLYAGFLALDFKHCLGGFFVFKVGYFAFCVSYAVFNVACLLLKLINTVFHLIVDGEEALLLLLGEFQLLCEEVVLVLAQFLEPLLALDRALASFAGLLGVA